MSNLAIAFRQEIARLARREIRSQTRGLRKASVLLRRDVAALKRHVSELKSEVTRPGRQVGRHVEPQTAGPKPVKSRFNAKSVLSKRRSLGISAADYGKLVGVTGHTIYKWEHGASRPRRPQLAALASVRQLRKAEALARLEQLREKST